MADWAFNIWVGDPPPTRSAHYADAVMLRSYKRPQWVTGALPKIVIAFRAYIEVTLDGNQMTIIEAKRWLEPQSGDPPDWDRYFGEMMEEQRYYEREKERIRPSKEDEHATT